MKRIAVYKRVSTDMQDTNMQQHAITAWLDKQPVSCVAYYEDVGISGSTSARPEFQRLIADVTAGLVDAVVVYRLDRLSRHATDALSLLMSWIKADVDFIAVDQPILHLDKGNPFRLTFLALFSEIAQIERETIVQRINAGLRAAKARGVQLGRKRALTTQQREDALAARRRGDSFKEIAAQYAVTPATIFNALKHSRV